MNTDLDTSSIRRARGAGRWFPGDSAALRRMVNGFIEQAAAPRLAGRVVAGLAPHAGYVYSGRTAGFTFRALRDHVSDAGRGTTVVVLGFGHRESFSGVALMDGAAIETPLGRTALDVAAGRHLAAGSKRILFACAPHAGEHSAENEIPFVQVALPESRLVVGLLGDHDPETLDDLVTALGTLAERQSVVVVASTDLLHDADYERVTKTDQSTLKSIVAMDHRGLQRGWSYGHQVCCGIGPVLAAMRFAEAQGCREGTLLHYENSGDAFPESRGEWVVGYGAVAFAAVP